MKEAKVPFSKTPAFYILNVVFIGQMRRRKVLACLVPRYCEAVLSSNYPVIQACEVLTSIDNLVHDNQGGALTIEDKVTLLILLGEALKNSQTKDELISEKQVNPIKEILQMIDWKVDQYRSGRIGWTEFNTPYHFRHWRGKAKTVKS